MVEWVNRPVPRYYFHTEDGERLCDPDGTQLSGIEAAKKEAVRCLSERLDNDPRELWETGAWRVIVQDEKGLTLFIIDVSTTLSAAFPLSAAPNYRPAQG